MNKKMNKKTHTKNKNKKQKFLNVKFKAQDYILLLKVTTQNLI